MERKTRFTEAEQRAFEAEMKAAGIGIEYPAASTVTLLAKRPTAEPPEDKRRT